MEPASISLWVTGLGRSAAGSGSMGSSPSSGSMASSASFQAQPCNTLPVCTISWVAMSWNCSSVTAWCRLWRMLSRSSVSFWADRLPRAWLAVLNRSSRLPVAWSSRPSRRLRSVIAMSSESWRSATRFTGRATDGGVCSIIGWSMVDRALGMDRRPLVGFRVLQFSRSESTCIGR